MQLCGRGSFRRWDNGTYWRQPTPCIYSIMQHAAAALYCKISTDMVFTPVKHRIASNYYGSISSGQVWKNLSLIPLGATRTGATNYFQQYNCTFGHCWHQWVLSLFYVWLSVHPSNGIFTLTFEGFQWLTWNLAGWCTVPGRRYGPGVKDDIII